MLDILHIFDDLMQKPIYSTDMKPTVVKKNGKRDSKWSYWTMIFMTN